MLVCYEAFTRLVTEHTDLQKASMVHLGMAELARELEATLLARDVVTPDFRFCREAKISSTPMLISLSRYDSLSAVEVRIQRRSPHRHFLSS